MNISPKKENQRKTQTISPELAQLLVEQIPRELHNHAIYRTFANFFALKGLPDLETYYIHRADEEINHHRWIVDRLNYCDVAFCYPATPPVIEEFPEDEELACIFPFERTVTLEIETTEWIFKIADYAKEECDWQTFYWLQQTLIDEQNEEEATSRTALDIACMKDASWIRKSKEILKLLKK